MEGYGHMYAPDSHMNKPRKGTVRQEIVRQREVGEKATVRCFNPHGREMAPLQLVTAVTLVPVPKDEESPSPYVVDPAALQKV